MTRLGTSKSLALAAWAPLALLSAAPAWAACETTSATTGGVSGSPFAATNATKMAEQTSDNVRITGGCIGVSQLMVGGAIAAATLPVSTAAGELAISANFDGTDAVDFWNTKHSTGLPNEGFSWWQKLSASTYVTLAYLYGAADGSEFRVADSTHAGYLGINSIEGYAGTGTNIPFTLYANDVAVLTVDQALHLRTHGTAPALTSCGTGSPAITGTDVAGIVTMGTNATGCVITFNVAYTGAPFCVVTWIATPLASQSYVTANTAITLTQTSASGNKAQYVCVGQTGG